jgi:hypothetical protein
MKTRNVLALFILMCGNATSIRGGPNVRFVPSPTQELTITPANADNLPGFDSSAVSKFHPAAFILTNQSNRAIVGLAVRWAYVDENGRRGLLTHQSDSFSTPNAIAVISPRSRLLVAPGVFLPESLAQSAHIGPPLEALDGRSATDMATASEITVQIDSIIFEDGQVVGPNDSQLDAEIQGRRIAATELAKQIRNAQSRGEEPTFTLRQILEKAKEAPPYRSDRISQWTLKYSRRLLKAPVFEKRLAQLENMPAPPNFYVEKGHNNEKPN